MYTPLQWTVTEASDTWAVGLVAYKLLWAGNGETARQKLDNEIVEIAQQWPTLLTALDEDFDIDDDDQSYKPLIHLGDPEIPGDYSIGLIRFVQHCLRLLPWKRPGLQEMRDTINANLQRLDRLYGDEIKKGQEDLDESHKVYVSSDIDDYRDFDVGQEYEPPTKRRRVTISGAENNEYRAIVDDWADTDKYPRPTLEFQAAVIDAIERCVHESDTYVDASHLPTYHYLLQCLRSRITPEAAIDIVTERENDEFLLAFGKEAKTEVLDRIVQYIIPKLQEDETLGEHGDAVQALTHAVQWAAFLVKEDGEPEMPKLREKTEIHRALRDWIFIIPDGVF